MLITFRTIALMMLAALTAPLSAGASSSYQSEAVNARLITAQSGIAPNASTLSAGLHLQLGDGWKTYWRSPGEVGIPPAIDWEGSSNIANVDFLWPVPTRFRAFGIENFGYDKEVVFPLEIALNEAGAPVRLKASVQLLVCSAICVPEDFVLDLGLGEGVGFNQADADLISQYAARVPDDGGNSGFALGNVALIDDGGQALVAMVRSAEPMKAPDIFPEMSQATAFGTPDIRLDEADRSLWARVPILSRDGDDRSVQLTIADGARAATLQVETLADAAPSPPFALEARASSFQELAWIALIAMLGGLILNVMPCVLPVLSIKLSGALKSERQSTARLRAGFLVSALGVMTFVWVLAIGTIAIKSLGGSVGWGIQFQNPIFLSALTAMLALFAANLFGLFDIHLPASASTKLADASGQPSFAGDFATGGFAAMLATPCSAPFLGTAVAFALAGSSIDIVVIFSALGLGLALPYLLIAARPQWLKVLPKPGRWMAVLKIGLGVLLALTAVWLLWVLSGVAGQIAMLLVIGLLAGGLVFLALPARTLSPRWRWGITIPLLAASVLAPPLAATDRDGGQDIAALSDADIGWVRFDQGAIPRLISEGRIVFVDVTADWCLTCKANKALVIERGEVARLLIDGDVIPMQADWTRPDDNIARYLEANNRFGIPFNAVYGPAAPEGIILPEILTQDAVLDAMARARLEVNAKGQTVQATQPN